MMIIVMIFICKMINIVNNKNKIRYNIIKYNQTYNKLKINQTYNKLKINYIYNKIIQIYNKINFKIY